MTIFGITIVFLCACCFYTVTMVSQMPYTLNDSNEDWEIKVEKERIPKFILFEQFWNQVANSSDIETMQSQITQGHTAPPKHKWLRDNSSETMYNSNSTVGIPKIINKIYIEKSGMFPTKEDMKRTGTGSLVEAHNSWSLNNHGYEIRYFNLNLCRQYVKENFHVVFLRAFDCIEAFAGKVNLFRMLVVYAEGGWYSDWKQTCLKQNVLNSIGENVDLFVAWDHGHDGLKADKCLQNCFFGAIPRHPLIAEMIQTILSNVRNEVYGKHALYTTGPCVFGKVLAKYVEEQNPRKERVRMGYFKNGHISTSENNGEAFVEHKCRGCGNGQSWNKGNNYNTLFSDGKYYCQDAKSLFNTAVVTVQNDQVLL